MMERDLVIIAHDVGPVGGMERQLTELIRGLVSGGRRLTVVSRTCELPADVAVRHVRVPGPSRPFPIAYLWFLLAGSLLVRRIRGQALVQATGAVIFNRVDVCAVHLCHHGLAQRADVLRVRRDRRAYRVNARVAAVLSRLGERVCFPRARRLAAVSAGVAREVEEAFPALRDRVSVVPNGVDAQRFRPGRNGSRGLSACFVGGEWEGKGLGVAIRALPHAPEWALDVVGDGERGRFEALAAALGVTDRVRFHGRRADPEAVYRASDAFVLPSMYETFSLVTYEAAASGLPLLATRVSGIEDLLRDGVNGWFINRDPVDLGARLEALGAQPDLRSSMGAAARAAAERFTWAAMVQRHVELYASLETPGGGSPS